MRSRRLAALVSIALVSFAVAALAQRKPPPNTRPKPPVVVDAGADNPYEGSASAASTDAGTVSPVAVADGGGPVPPPPMMHADMIDGGVRASPLTPAPNEFAQPIDAGATTVDYDKLIGDIAALRARVAAVGDNLFHSRIQIQIRTDGDHARIGRLVLSLDDGAVYTAPNNFKSDDYQEVYGHSLAAGHHAITVDIERKDERNDAFRTSQRTRFTVEIPRDQQLVVQIRVGDDSSMGKDFPGDKSGNYDMRVRVKAEAHGAGIK